MYILKRWYRYVPNPPYLITWVSGKGFLVPGNGREIENHIPVLREGNGNLQIATGREGKFEACNPGNPGKSRESYKKQD